MSKLPQDWTAFVLDTKGKPVGLGTMLRPRKLITCAHVINRAIDRDEYEQEPPWQTAIQILPLHLGKPIVARVLCWHPPARTFVGAAFQDICLLEAETDWSEGPSWSDLLRQEPREGNEVRVLGCPLPGKVSRGSILAGPVAGGWWQVDPPARGVRIDRGFSGSLVWDANEDSAVGIVVALDTTDDTSYLIPTRLLHEAFSGPPDDRPRGTATVGVTETPGEPFDVFLCHNNHDKASVRELAESLRDRGVRVFLDEWVLRPGQPWQESIERAIQRSGSAAILFGPSGLGLWAEREMRALIEEFVHRKIPLIPILLPGAHEKPELPVLLRDFQWMDLRSGLRPKALEELVQGIRASPAPSPFTQEPLRLFRFTGVPPLPPQYQGRREYGDLAKALVSPTPQPLALIGQSRRFAVQGMGGVGKTMLAAALARDPGVRRAFPDGTHWITLGQEPDLLGLQVKLAGTLGVDASRIDTVQSGRELLKESLQDKACLLVLDDVWDANHGRAFDVLGERGKLLLTTRNEGVSKGLNADQRRLEELPSDEARTLLARYSGMEPDELPEEAVAIIRECGELPLALAIVGSLLRERPRNRWPNVLAKLRQADLGDLGTLPGEPYRNLLAAIDVSVQELEPEERERYLDLAVFAEDTPIPESVLHTFWSPLGLDEFKVQDLIDKLVDRSLARRDAKGRLGLHDLQHDYVRRGARDPGQLHARFLQAYRRLCADGWHGGPDDGYFFEHLAEHLIAAGRRDELRSLLFDFRWLQAKLDATEPVALLNDFEQLDVSQDEPARLLAGALQLSSHVLSTRPKELASQLRGRLLRVGLPDIDELAERARGIGPRPALLPLRATLAAPGGHLLRTLEGHQGWVNAVALSADGKHALSGSGDKTLKLWDLASGELVAGFTADSSITALAVTASDRVVAGDALDKVHDLAIEW